MKFITPLTFCAFLVLLSACQSTSPTIDPEPVTVPAEVAEPTPAPVSLTETTWRLTELMGTPIPPPGEGDVPFTLVLDSSNNRLSVYAGCNQIGGDFLLDETKNSLRTQHLIQTQMECNNMGLEDKMLDVLTMMDSYSLRGNQLNLFRARMATLARFEPQ